MYHTMLKSKLHRATVTEANLEYEGSCTVDLDLLEKAKISLHEQVHIVNINNSERFITYVIPGERGSGTICLNGACARLAQVGDKVIIMSYGLLSDEEMKNYQPNVVLLGDNNSPSI